MNIEPDKYRYGFFNHGAGIGDGIIKTSIPENFYKNFGVKIIDIEKKWMYDYNPYVERNIKHDIALNILGNQIEIIQKNCRQSHLSHASEYCHNFNFPKCYTRSPKLYKYEDIETQKNQVAVHTQGNTVGAMPDHVIEQINKNYQNYDVIQIGGSFDKKTPFINKTGLSLWDTIKIIAESSIYIGVNSGFMHIANAYRKVRKKIVLHELSEERANIFTPLNYQDSFEWYDYGIEYFNIFDIDMGTTYKYKSI